MTLPRTVGRQQVVLALQERIKRGYYPPGSWLPAERTLAEEFGMDRSAIRRALIQLEDRNLIVRETGKRPWVRDDQSVEVKDADRVGANHAPEVGLRTIVAILPHHPIYPASLAILHGINATIRSMEAPFRLQIIDTHGGSELRETSLERQALESVIHEKIAGVVLWHMGGTETLPQLQELESRGIPVVFVDRYPAELACDFVGIDNHAGVESVITHLRRLGHRRIAHLTTDEQTTAVLERRVAYWEVLLNTGVTPEPQWIFTAPHAKTTDVSPACDQFFTLAEPPTAVFAMNDSLAYQFIAECQRRGMDVPGDISVVGCDDLEQHSPRPALLTTLHQPFDQIGRRAASLLLRRLTGSEVSPEIRQHVYLPTHMIKRLTCRVL